MPQRRPYTFDRVVRILFSVCAIIAVLVLINALKGVLLPFLVACVIAYTLEPVVKWNAKILHTRRRFLPVLLTLMEIIILMTGIGMILVPYITSEGAHMANLIKQYANSQIDTPFLPQSVHDFIKDNITVDSLTSLFSRDEIIAIVKNAVSGSWSFLSSGLSFIIGLLSWVVVILYVIFIMLDYEKLILSFRQLVPHRHRNKVLGVISDVKNAMNCYFRGQFCIAMLVGILFAIGFYIVGLPMGVVLGLFIGMLNMVPYLQLISLPITAILCLVCSVDTGIDFWTIFWECMAVYLIVQVIQDLYLTPRIMGKAMGLNPAIILLALSVWGSLLGFLGLIIALPLTTLLLSYYDRFVVQPMKYEHPRPPHHSESPLEESIEEPFEETE